MTKFVLENKMVLRKERHTKGMTEEGTIEMPYLLPRSLG
jgi:hypothetical protein